MAAAGRGRHHPALPPARPVLVPVAAAGDRDRGQHRRRLSLVQQKLQLLLRRLRPVSRLLVRGLLRRPATIAAPKPSEELLREVGERLDRATQRRLGRSLAIREVDAGSCNGCELEVNALGNAVYDLERFGIRFVASPRHADVLLVTGPVTLNMREALLRTWNCTPAPKWLVAAGDCALGLGPFVGSPALVEGSGAVDMVLPVHLRLRGCPPKPIELLEGLLALLEP